MGNSPPVPHHWTKINSEADAHPGDEVYVNEDTQEVYVRGQVSNTTKEAIAASYGGISTGDVSFPLKKKR
jgi:hypothetical protein